MSDPISDINELSIVVGENKKFMAKHFLFCECGDKQASSPPASDSHAFSLENDMGKREKDGHASRQVMRRWAALSLTVDDGQKNCGQTEKISLTNLGVCDRMVIEGV